ncbi:MAG: hypothetical protein ACRDZ6_04200 [Acidimicrobiales bacterium]
MTASSKTAERLRLAAAAAAVVVLVAVPSAGCAQSDAHALAVRVCGTVRSSLRLERRAEAASPAAAAPLRHRAVLALQNVEPMAAIAAGEDPTWQALQATLSEVGAVPLRLLAQALGAQCSGVS